MIRQQISEFAALATMFVAGYACMIVI